MIKMTACNALLQVRFDFGLRVLFRALTITSLGSSTFQTYYILNRKLKSHCLQSGLSSSRPPRYHLLTNPPSQMLNTVAKRITTYQLHSYSSFSPCSSARASEAGHGGGGVDFSREASSSRRSLSRRQSGSVHAHALAAHHLSEQHPAGGGTLLHPSSNPPQRTGTAVGGGSHVVGSRESLPPGEEIVSPTFELNPSPSNERTPVAADAVDGGGGGDNTKGRSGGEVHMAWATVGRG